jgi:hypothetical protein
MKIENRSVYHDNDEIKKIIKFVMPEFVKEVLERYQKEISLTFAIYNGPFSWTE